MNYLVDNRIIKIVVIDKIGFYIILNSHYNIKILFIVLTLISGENKKNTLDEIKNIDAEKEDVENDNTSKRKVEVKYYR